MEVLVYLVLGLSIWILVPSERSALLHRTNERAAQGAERLAARADSEGRQPEARVDASDR